VIDVENLRPHYALTLRHWLERFERCLPKVREMYDEKFIRMWRMYLGASASAFETGGLQLFQVVFLPSSRPDYPYTRAHLYRAPRN
jgi:cyclopropane-fatty-acyl-phospholipid synthase